MEVKSVPLHISNNLTEISLTYCHIIFLKFLRDLMVVYIKIVVHMIQQTA
jgi:hypothetical protein